jgi:hypothetical protein
MPVASMSALDLTSRPPQRPAPGLERRGFYHSTSARWNARRECHKPHARSRLRLDACTPHDACTPLDVRTTPVRPTPFRCPPTRTLGRWLLMRHPPSSTPTPTQRTRARPHPARRMSVPYNGRPAGRLPLACPCQCARWENPPRPLNTLVPSRTPLDVCRSPAQPLATRVPVSMSALGKPTCAGPRRPRRHPPVRR